MMKPLRKRHLQIWITWAFLLPVGILFAWLVIPNSTPVKLLQPENMDRLPMIKGSIEKTEYNVHLRSNSGSSEWQLEWENKTVLTIPSAVIYRVKEGNKQTDKNELIGRIESRGDYVFPIKSDSSISGSFQFILYDFIHQKIIDSIKFQ